MHPTTSNRETLSSKPHILLLDGLRGVAAIVVVLFHFLEIVIPDFSQNILAHGFLAVDFFFCLSGFVVAYAYDDRMSTMSLKTFFKQRLMRLHPLVLFGAVLGVLAFLFTPIGNTASSYSVVQIVVLFLASAFLIPYPTMEDRYFNVFGLNAPSWSLFWEYVANLVYAVFLVKLHRRWLVVLAIIGAVFLLYVAQTSGSLIGGWNGETFWDGGARMLFSFTAGMCVFRYRLILKNKIGFIGVALLLTLGFMVPYHAEYNAITEPALVILMFPLILMLGAGSTIRPAQEKVCRLLGDLSYPLYMTHYFAMWAFGSYVSEANPDTPTMIVVIILVFIVQVLVAYGALTLYDMTVRAWLKKKML